MMARVRRSRASSRTPYIVTSAILLKMPMMAITTSNSAKVNPRDPAAEVVAVCSQNSFSRALHRTFGEIGNVVVVAPARRKVVVT